MFTVTVTLDVEPGSIDEFAEAVSAVARESVSQETGCLRFDVNRVMDFPGRFLLYEVYLDEEAFTIHHKGSAHFAAFIARSTPLTIPGSKSEILAKLAETESKSHDNLRF